LETFWEGHKNSDIGVSENAFELMKVFIMILGSHEEHVRNFWDQPMAPTLGTTFRNFGFTLCIGCNIQLTSIMSVAYPNVAIACVYCATSDSWVDRPFEAHESTGHG
jgi:hypothetical protein